MNAEQIALKHKLESYFLAHLLPEPLTRTLMRDVKKVRIHIAERRQELIQLGVLTAPVE